jgi:hypothetical protein
MVLNVPAKSKLTLGEKLQRTPAPAKRAASLPPSM